jgi:hypothetical protein
MRRLTLVCALAALALTAPAAAHSQSTPSPNAVDETPATCDENTISLHVGKSKAVIRHAYAHRRWRKAHPFKRGHQRRVNQHKRCLLRRSDRKVIGHYRVAKLHSFRKYRHKKLQDSGNWCAPNPHPQGAGCWVIPSSIVSCESGGSWNAANPSGAVGPYQLLGWGAPFPVRSQAQAMQHHAIATRVWAGGSGRSNWVC